MVARLLLVALAASCCIPLFGATSALPPPVVVVYPLSVSGGADPEAGASIAVAMAQRLSTAGGIVVKPYPPGTQRVAYLTTAQTMNADYYVSGFLTPLGDQISMVTQVVSVASGTVIFSSSAFVRTYTDAAAQADTVQVAILRHAGRALAILDAPRETPAPKAAEKNEANLSGLFKKRKKTAPAATPTPSETTRPAPSSPKAVAVARATAAPRKTRAPRAIASLRPASVATAAALAPALPIALATPRPNSSALARLRLAAAILVLDVAGEADAGLASYAQDSIVRAIGRGGTTVAGLPADPADLPARARDFCGLAFGSKALYAPTLSFERDRTGNRTDVELDVVAYDCAGNVTGRQHSRARIGNRGVQAAVDRASDDAAGAFAFANQGR